MYDSEGTLLTISLSKFSNITLKCFRTYLNLYTKDATKVSPLTRKNNKILDKLYYQNAFLISSFKNLSAGAVGSLDLED